MRAALPGATLVWLESPSNPGLAVLDLPGFTKFEVTGAGAPAWLDHMVAGVVPKPGRTALNYFLNDKGGIVTEMTITHLGSGRYYVEHLLFFVHFHAFFFLCGIAVLLLGRLSAMFAGTAAASALSGAESILTAVLIFYVPYYLYRAMRRVYGQGRTVTLVKYSLLETEGIMEMAGLLMAFCRQLDLALLRIEAKDLPSLELGDSDALSVGEC